MNRIKFISFISFAILAMVAVSCTEKKNVKDSPVTPGSVENDTLTRVDRLEEQVKHEHKSNDKTLAGKDISNNKQTCSACNGTGKKGKEQCKECLGYGYILVYK